MCKEIMPKMPEDCLRENMAAYGRITQPGRNARGLRRFARPSRRPLRSFANANPVVEEFLPPPGANPQLGTQLAAMANAIDTQPGSDGWMRLVLFGEHPYGGPDDIQVFDAESARAMVRRFKAAANALVRAVFRTQAFLPVYHGHPDHPSFSVEGHDDFTLRARITDMEVRDDGLYVRPEFTDAGNALLEAGQKLYWSPRWLTELIRNTGGKRYWRPFKLLSAGLWPTPNIYGSAANAQPDSTKKDNPMPDWIKQILILLGFTQDQVTAAVDQSDGAPTPEEITARAKERLDAANGYWDLQVALMKALGFSDDEINAFRNEDAGAPTIEEITRRLQEKMGTTADLEEDTADQANARIRALEQDLATERRGRAELLVDQAIADGRVNGADRTFEINALAKSSDFANASVALLTRRRVLPVGGQHHSDDLGQRKGEMQAHANAREEFRTALADFANSQKLDLDMDYHKAYARFKATSKGQALLERMAAPQ